MTTGNASLDKCVETLCEQGCRAVLVNIDALQAGHTLQGFADLDSAERELLLRELQAIMLVYNNRCRL